MTRTSEHQSISLAFTFIEGEKLWPRTAGLAGNGGDDSANQSTKSVSQAVRQPVSLSVSQGWPTDRLSGPLTQVVAPTGLHSAVTPPRLLDWCGVGTLVAAFWLMMHSVGAERRVGEKVEGGVKCDGRCVVVVVSGRHYPKVVEGFWNELCLKYY